MLGIFHDLEFMEGLCDPEGEWVQCICQKGNDGMNSYRSSHIHESVCSDSSLTVWHRFSALKKKAGCR